MNTPPRYTRLRDFESFSLDISQRPTVRTFTTSLVEYEVVQPVVPVQPVQLVQPAQPVVPVPVTVVKTPEPSTEGKKKKAWIGTVARVGGTLLLFGLLFKSVSWQLVMKSLVQTQHGMLLVGFIVGFCGIVLSAYQWRSLLSVERISSDLAVLINYYVVGIAFSHFLPTGMGGDAIKALYVGRESGNSAGSASAVLLCRITGFFSMLLIALPPLLFWHNRFDVKLMISFLFLALGVGGAIGGALCAVIFLPRFIRGRWGKHRFLAPVIKVGNAVSTTLQRPHTLLMAHFYGMIFWLVAILNCYSYGEALHLNVPLYFYFFVVPLISLVSFLPISINGFGLREAAFVYAFSTVHVASAPALLLALLMDIQALCFAIVGGGIYLTRSGKLSAARERKAA